MNVIKVSALFATILGFAVGINSQETKPTPTLEVCNARVNLWIAQTDVFIPYGPEIRKMVNALSSEDIFNRERFVTDCMLTDLKELKAISETERPAKVQKLGIKLDEARLLLQLYSDEQRTRYFNFIARNKLRPKFDQEDKAGER